ncbi:hypothetical protein ACIOYV_27550 [Pseudomonas sp. NPDC087342]|uniref:hypothetical protein n=1 Tax=Pseudomonas sp. NPDC087342 TaxID=3364437 RepID=UPI003804CB22
MSAAKQFHAQIDGKQIQGWVVKDGRSYLAYADFRGKQIVARGSSEPNAISKWREEAGYAANE